jgi:hypothetical protein
MNDMPSKTREWPRDRKAFGWAWTLLCLVLAIHVADEALNDFLAVYNPAVLNLRSSIPWLNLPTFNFPLWISLLGMAVIALSVLTPHAFRGAWGMRPMAYIFSAIMLVNGIGHIAAVLYSGKAIPGIYSSPLVLASAVYLWYTNQPGTPQSNDGNE